MHSFISYYGDSNVTLVMHWPFAAQLNVHFQQWPMPPPVLITFIAPAHERDSQAEWPG